MIPTWGEISEPLKVHFQKSEVWGRAQAIALLIPWWCRCLVPAANLWSRGRRSSSLQSGLVSVGRVREPHSSLAGTMASLLSWGSSCSFMWMSHGVLGWFICIYKVPQKRMLNKIEAETRFPVTPAIRDSCKPGRKQTEKRGGGGDAHWAGLEEGTPELTPPHLLSMQHRLHAVFWSREGQSVTPTLQKLRHVWNEVNKREEGRKRDDIESWHWWEAVKQKGAGWKKGTK